MGGKHSTAQLLWVTLLLMILAVCEDPICLPYNQSPTGVAPLRGHCEEVVHHLKNLPNPEKEIVFSSDDIPGRFHKVPDVFPKKSCVVELVIDHGKDRDTSSPVKVAETVELIMNKCVDAFSSSSQKRHGNDSNFVQYYGGRAHCGQMNRIRVSISGRNWATSTDGNLTLPLLPNHGNATSQ